MSTKTALTEVPQDDEQVPAVVQETSLINIIADAASNPDVSVDKLERLFALQERVMDRNAQTAFVDAMNKAQDEMRPISQDASNPQTHSKYASYAALDKALRPIYTKHGFSVSFDTGDTAPGEYVTVIAHVAHRSGHVEMRNLMIAADGKGAKGNDVMTKTHATMSAVSYGRRGLLKMIFNISEGDNDDDGNAAGGVVITSEQAEYINEELDRMDGNKAAFCEYMGVSSIPEIPLTQYGKADNALKKKAAEHAGEKPA